MIPTPTGCNHSISCYVDNCAYNNCDEKLCSLNKISVGTNQSAPTSAQAVNCQSFETKKY